MFVDLALCPDGVATLMADRNHIESHVHYKWISVLNKVQVTVDGTSNSPCVSQGKIRQSGRRI